MNQGFARCIGFFCMACTSYTYSVGLAVAPMEQVVKGSKAATYVTSNQEEKAVAVEVIVEEWKINEDGLEVRIPSTDLVAYPRQFILKGSTAKNVKVGRRNSRTPIDIERTYRVTIRELPVSLEPEEPGTFHVYRASAYRTSYYLQPKNPRIKIDLAGAEIKDGSLQIKLHNSGNTHIHLQNPVLTLNYSDGSEKEFRGDDVLVPMAGENMHAQSTRRFAFALNQLQEEGQRISGGGLKFEDKGILASQPIQFSL